MFNNKIGFDFLNDGQIAERLPLIDLSHNIKLAITNIEESKQNFINMIFGQTVYALKSWSTKINHSFHNGPQCVVSTIFREITSDSSSNYLSGLSFNTIACTFQWKSIYAYISSRRKCLESIQTRGRLYYGTMTNYRPVVYCPRSHIVMNLQ